MALAISERLKDLRVQRGLTLEQLAEQTGLSRSALGSYEADECKDISHYALIKLAKFYGVTADYLLGLTETKVQFIDDNFSLPVVIRKATRDDYGAVSALEELEFDIHRQARPDYFKSLRNSYTEEEFEELLAHSCPICWLAVQNEALVGLCFGKIEKTPDNPVCKSRLVAFIQDIVTLPKYRGKGIATALMVKTREQALNEGAVSMELCVWNFNAAAIRLYEKMGMRIQYYRMEENLTKTDN